MGDLVAPAADTHQLVVFTLGGEQYALPIKQIQEIIRYRQPRSVASREYWIRGVLSLRGKIVPIFDLAQRLSVSSEIDDRLVVLLDPSAIFESAIAA